VLKAAHHLLQCMLCCMAVVDALYTLAELFGLGFDTWHLQLWSVALTTDDLKQSACAGMHCNNFLQCCGKCDVMLLSYVAVLGQTEGPWSSLGMVTPSATSRSPPLHPTQLHRRNLHRQQRAQQTEVNDSHLLLCVFVMSHHVKALLCSSTLYFVSSTTKFSV